VLLDLLRASIVSALLMTPKLLIMDPLAIALKEIAETKSLLQSLLKSSESFDYSQARAVLKELERKVRDLTRTRLQFEKAHKAAKPEIHMLDFTASLSGPNDARTT
jgi:hypothetical protein